MVTVSVQLPLVAVVAVLQPDPPEPGFPTFVAVTEKVCEANTMPTFSTKIAVTREPTITAGFIQERTWHMLNIRLLTTRKGSILHRNLILEPIRSVILYGSHPFPK